MSNAANALIQMEQGQSLTAYAAMTDSGDHIVFTAGTVWSNATGKTPSIRPNGIVSGSNLVTPAVSLTNNCVDVAAFTAYSIGVLQEVSASTDEAITRPASAVAKVNSITMTSAGAIAVVAGTDGATTTFSETRDAAGGPPLIPVDSVEIAQVRVISDTAAPITAAEIFQVVGTHTERSDFPSFDVNPVGEGIGAASSSKQTAHISFASANPLIHTGPIARKVYAQYYTPVYGNISKTVDFVPADYSYSITSTQYYGGSTASSSQSIGQASFTALLNDGVADTVVQSKGDTRTFKFFPDRNQSSYVLTQGKVGVARTYPAADQIQAVITVTAEVPSVEFTS